MIEYFQEMWGLVQNGEKQGYLFFICLYMMCVCLYSLIFQVRINRWPEVAGDLEQSNVKEFGGREWRKSDQDYVANALYTYEVNGKTYQGKRISPWVIVASHNARFILEQQLKGVKRLPDGKVSVFYNPKNPNKSWLIKTGFKSQLFTALCAFGPYVLYYAEYIN